MSSFGTQYIVSAVAKTGFLTDDLLKYLFEQRKDQLAIIATSQKTQMDATNALAKQTKDALDHQADSTEEQANGSIASGAFLTFGSAAQAGTMAYRTNNAEFKGMNDESANHSSWDKILKGEDPGAELISGSRPLNKEQEISLNTIREKGFGNTNPGKEEDAVGVVKALRGSKTTEQLTRELSEEKADLRSRRDEYNGKTRSIGETLFSLNQGISPLSVGIANKMSAEETRAQAQAQAAQQYADNFLKSTTDNIQTTKQAFDGLNQTIDQAAQNYITNLARANQAA